MSKKKKVAFYHMGDNYIAFKVVAKTLDLIPIELPKPNLASVSKGVSISPEFSCFPFKVFIGSYMQAIELGADVIMTNSSEGVRACQYSDFAYTQKEILKKNGYNVEMIVIDKLSPNDVLKKLKEYKKSITLKQVTETLILFAQKVFLLEDADNYARKIHLASGRKKADAWKSKWLKMIDETDSMVELYKFNAKMKWEFDKHPKINYDDAIKIAVIGDIYSINVDYINNNLFERLADLGIYAEKGHGLGDLLKEKITFEFSDAPKKSRKYLKHNAGGLSQETVISAIHYAERKYDGLIHIYPFNCMPETVVRTILPKLAADYDIPTLFLPIDEQTGDAGFSTRIDAFIDLIKIRKEKKLKESKKNKLEGIKNEILSWR